MLPTTNWSWYIKAVHLDPSWEKKVLQLSKILVLCDHAVKADLAEMHELLTLEVLVTTIDALGHL